jgi:hypothetical protein
MYTGDGDQLWSHDIKKNHGIFQKFVTYRDKELRIIPDTEYTEVLVNSNGIPCQQNSIYAIKILQKFLEGYTHRKYMCMQ